MSSWWNDLKNSILGAVSIRAGTIHTATGNGTGKDLLEGDGGSCAIIHVGTITDGTHTITVEESDAVGGTYAAVPNADSKAIAAADSDLVYVLNFKRTNRWVRAVKTVAGATTGGHYSVSVHSMKKAG